MGYRLMVEESRIGFPDVSRNWSASASPEKVSLETHWQPYVQRIATGDESALAALYDESSQLVYSMVLRILRNPLDADEVTLEVYFQVWRTAQSYNEGRGSVGAWLVMLARSRAIDRLRSRGAQEGLEEPQKAYVETGSAAPLPDQEAEISLQRRRVLSALEALPPEQREALELAFFLGFTHGELAERLNQPLGTVKTRIRKGMIRLRELLGDRT
jgi:RNA polymerase sigma-70 factor (ECF subfamily)